VRQVYIKLRLQAEVHADLLEQVYRFLV